MGSVREEAPERLLDVGALRERRVLQLWRVPHVRVGAGDALDGRIEPCEALVGEAGEIGAAKLASGYFTLTRRDSESRFFGLLAPSGEFKFET